MDKKAEIHSGEKSETAFVTGILVLFEGQQKHSR